MKPSPSPKDEQPVRVTVQHIGLGSFVKWQTLTFFILGVFAGLIYTAWFAVAGQISRSVALWYFLVVAFVYAILGFVSSTIIGIVYNSLASKLGGMRFDIVTHNNPIPPPPPERWEGTLPKINDPEIPGRA